MGGDILSGYTDYERGSLAMGAAASKQNNPTTYWGNKRAQPHTLTKQMCSLESASSTNDNHLTFMCRRRSICKQSG